MIISYYVYHPDHGGTSQAQLLRTKWQVADHGVLQRIQLIKKHKIIKIVTCRLNWVHFTTLLINIYDYIIQCIPSGSWRHKSSSVTANKVTSGGSWCPSAYSTNKKHKISKIVTRQSNWVHFTTFIIDIYDYNIQYTFRIMAAQVKLSYCEQSDKWRIMVSFSVFKC